MFQIFEMYLVSTCFNTEKTIFPFPFKLSGIWSWWQFSFRFLNQMEFHLVQNWKGNCHHDHIPFNLNGNVDILFSVNIEENFSCDSNIWNVLLGFNGHLLGIYYNFFYFGNIGEIVWFSLRQYMEISEMYYWDFVCSYFMGISWFCAIFWIFFM